jgi:hypothetical protein
MSRHSDIMIEMAEDEAREQKVEWIRKELKNPDANEYTNGWDELEEEYDSQHNPDYYEEDEHYDEDYWTVLGQSKYEIFYEIMESSKMLNVFNIHPIAYKNMLVMLYGHIVAAVEAYLSSTFIDTVLSSENMLRKLVESDPEFAKRKFTMKEIFIKKDKLKDDVTIYLKEIIFHKISKIKPMYKDVLDIDFGDVKWLFDAVTLRHHCVHRAGYDKEGNEVSLDKNKISDLIKNCTNLVASIEANIIKLQNEESFFNKT